MMFPFWSHFLTVENPDGYSFQCKHCGEKLDENADSDLTIGAMKGHFYARHSAPPKRITATEIERRQREFTEIEDMLIEHIRATTRYYFRKLSDLLEKN